MRLSKILLGSAAVIALSLGYASDARAFDDIDWNWQKDVVSTETIDVDVDINLVPSGLVEVEKTQVNIGDVTATSIVLGVDNSPPGEAEGTVLATFDTEIDLTAGYDDNAENNPITGVVINSDGLTGSNGAGNVDNNGNEVNMTFDLEGEVEVDLSKVEFSGINDAVDLPSVVSSATAVANNQSISSTVALNLHDGQYNMGEIGIEERPQYDLPGYAGDIAEFLVSTDNTHTDILAIASMGAALNIIQQGDVDAFSGVGFIHNASVDSSATAIGNNISVDLDAATAGDAFAIADITQFNYADVNALSIVGAVEVDNYMNMGALEGPLVSSVATAIGNNASISVSSPAVGPL